MAKMAGSGATGTPPFIPTGGGAGAGLDLLGILNRGAPGSILPERGSQSQYDMVMGALQGAAGSVGQTGSPLLAFLAPMLGGAVGARTQGLYDDVTETQNDAATGTILDAMGQNRASGGSPGRVIYDSPQQVGSTQGRRNSAMANNGGPTRAAAAAMGNSDRDLLAQTLMAEAGGEGPDGMLAAGAVINNRLNSGDYGQSLRDVIMAPGQFSAWNSVTGYAGGEGGLDMTRMQPSDAAYQVTDALLSGQYTDPTGGATHYYNPSAADPAWGQRGGGDWERIGNHVFGSAGGRPGAGGGASFNLPTLPGQAAMDRGSMEALLGVMTNDRVNPALQSLASNMLGDAGGAAPSPADQLDYQSAWLDLQKSMMGGDPVKGVNVGGALVDPYTGEELYRAPADPSDRATVKAPDGNTYYTDTGERVLPPGVGDAPGGLDASRARQVNTAITNINARISEMLNQLNPDTGDFFTREEAITMTRNDPLLGRLWAIVDGVGAGGAGAPAGLSTGSAPAAPTAPPTPSLPTDPAPRGQGGVARPQSKEDYDALPSGTRFVDPEGTVRIKP